jgi:hypothetical protein
LANFGETPRTPGSFPAPGGGRGDQDPIRQPLNPLDDDAGQLRHQQPGTTQDHTADMITRTLSLHRATRRVKRSRNVG